eukprot:TRINITY_DN4636_c0_g1_i1.p1 TRINITY_DN4636_c0_g1~~TRINITY_DN4636_c0_g1_i1.p1  ORF type:complete len:582 (-),score=85.86 TRINITY_DN4636_c0_g1_i1:153-1898(-)
MLLWVLSICIVLTFCTHTTQSDVLGSSFNPTKNLADDLISLRSFLSFSLNIENFHPTTSLSQRYLPILKRIYSTYVRELPTYQWETRHLLLACLSEEFGNATIAELKLSHEVKERNFEVAFVAEQVNKLDSFLNALFSLYPEKTLEEGKKIVVVGGGPVGLLHAIAAKSKGHFPVVYEKRRRYFRNILFDLGPQSWYPSHERLLSLGWEYQNIPNSVQVTLSNDGNITTVSCHLLEKFFAKVLSIIDVDLNYGVKFLDISEHQDRQFAVFSQPTKDTFKIEFDILIGADGAKSDVREILDIPFQNIEKFKILKGLATKNIKGIHQISVVMNFVGSSESRTCPSVKKNMHGDDVDFLHPSFVVPETGVTMVFKRWRFPYCSAQIFFNHEAGIRVKNLIETNDEDDYKSLWTLILKILNSFLETQISDTLSLHALLFSSKGSYINLVNTTVSVSGSPVVKIGKSFGLLVGDALMSSHYRLGIGMNTAFYMLTLFDTLLDCTQREASLDACVSEYEGLVSKRLEQASQFQLQAIFFESYCNLVMTTENNWNEVHLWYRDFEEFGREDTRGLERASSIEVLRKCR